MAEICAPKKRQLPVKSATPVYGRGNTTTTITTTTTKTDQSKDIPANATTEQPPIIRPHESHFPKQGRELTMDDPVPSNRQISDTFTLVSSTYEQSKEKEANVSHPTSLANHIIESDFKSVIKGNAYSTRLVVQSSKAMTAINSRLQVIQESQPLCELDQDPRGAVRDQQVVDHTDLAEVKVAKSGFRTFSKIQEKVQEVLGSSASDKKIDREAIKDNDYDEESPQSTPYQSHPVTGPPSFPYIGRLQYNSRFGTAISAADSRSGNSLASKEDQRFLEKSHRQALLRSKTMGKSRRLTNYIPPMTPGRTTEPVEVARIQRIYSRPRNAYLEKKTSTVAPGRISRRSTKRTVSTKDRERLPSRIEPQTSVHQPERTAFKKRLERYRRIKDRLLREGDKIGRANQADPVTRNTVGPAEFVRYLQAALGQAAAERSSNQVRTIPKIVISSPQAASTPKTMGPATPASRMSLQLSLRPSPVQSRPTSCFRRRWNRISRHWHSNHSSILSVESGVSSVPLSIYSSLSDRWDLSNYCERSKSVRYPESLQIHINPPSGSTEKSKTSESNLIRHEPVDQVNASDGASAVPGQEAPVALENILDVNHEGPLLSLGIDPNKHNPDPEAFYRTHHEAFQETGSFTQSTLDEIMVAGLSTTVTLKMSASAESPMPCSRPSRLARMALKSKTRLKRVKNKVKDKAKALYQKSIDAIKWQLCEREEESDEKPPKFAEWTKADVISPVVFSGNHSGRGYNEDWIVNMPAHHPNPGQFERDWLDALPSTPSTVPSPHLTADSLESEGNGTGDTAFGQTEGRRPQTSRSQKRALFSWFKSRHVST